MGLAKVRAFAQLRIERFAALNGAGRHKGIAQPRTEGLTALNGTGKCKGICSVTN